MTCWQHDWSDWVEFPVWDRYDKVRLPSTRRSFKMVPARGASGWIKEKYRYCQRCYEDQMVPVMPPKYVPPER